MSGNIYPRPHVYAMILRGGYPQAVFPAARYGYYGRGMTICIAYLSSFLNSLRAITFCDL